MPESFSNSCVNLGVRSLSASFTVFGVLGWHPEGGLPPSRFFSSHNTITSFVVKTRPGAWETLPNPVDVLFLFQSSGRFYCSWPPCPLSRLEL